MPEINNNLNQLNKKRDLIMNNYHQTWVFKSLHYEKSSHYRPLQGVEVSKISRLLAHKKEKVDIPAHRPPLTSLRRHPGVHFC